MVWDVSSGFYTPSFDAEKPKLRQSASFHMPDFGGLPKLQVLPLNGSETSGSVHYPEAEFTESVLPSHSIPNAVEPLHLGHEGLHPTSLQLENLLANHGWSDWTDPRELSDLWNNFPHYSYTEQMVAVSPARAGWGEGSSQAHVRGHETATSTRICFEVERSQGGGGDPILHNGSRSATELDCDRQLEALLRAAEASKLENKDGKFDSAFISEASSTIFPSTVCFQPEAACLANSRSIITTPTSASVPTPKTLRETTKATKEVRPKSTCAVDQASRLSKGTSLASLTKRILLPRISTNAIMLDVLQPSKILKRKADVQLNFPKTKQAEAKPSPSKDRNLRKRKMDHMEREQHRRDFMAAKLAELDDLLPGATSKRDRLSIMDDAMQRITHLQQEVQVLKEKHHILVATKRKTEPPKDRVTILTPVNVESTDTCRKSTSTLPQRLGITKMCQQLLPNSDAFAISSEQSVDHARKIVYVEFHIQLDNGFEQAPEVIRCEYKVNYLSNTMRTVEDMKLDVCRCSVTKMLNYIICVLFLKPRSNVSKYKGTAMTTQFAARLKYNQSFKFEPQRKQ